MVAARPKKGALFVRCTDEEAACIRQAAKSEHRSLSGFILNAVLTRIEAKGKLLRAGDQPDAKGAVASR